MDYFVIPLTGLRVAATVDTAEESAYDFVKNFGGITDPKIVFNNAAETVTIQYSYGELQDISAMMGPLRLAGLDTTFETMLDRYGTAAYKKKIANQELLDE